MTTYTAIPDSDIDPESPITTTMMTRMRDNPIAITEGAAGAPQNQTASIADAAITGAKLSKSFTSGSQSVGGTSTWTPSAGAYQMIETSGAVVAQIRVSGVWRQASPGVNGMLLLCDGSNMRLYNASGSPLTVYYQKF